MRASSAPTALANCFDCQHHDSLFGHRYDVDENFICHKELSTCISISGLLRFIHCKECIPIKELVKMIISQHPIISAIVA